MRLRSHPNVRGEDVQPLADCLGFCLTSAPDIGYELDSENVWMNGTKLLDEWFMMIFWKSIEDNKTLVPI